MVLRDTRWKPQIESKLSKQQDCFVFIGKYLLGACCHVGPVLGTEDTLVNKTKIPVCQNMIGDLGKKRSTFKNAMWYLRFYDINIPIQVDGPNEKKSFVIVVGL